MAKAKGLARKGGFCPVFITSLFYKKLPDINPQKLLPLVRKNCGKANPIDKDGSDVFGFAFPEYEATFENGDRVPPGCFALSLPSDKQTNNQTADAILKRSLQHTYDWDRARQAVASAPHNILITEMLACTLEYHARLKLFRGVVAALAQSAPCQAIHWLPSERVVRPATFLKHYKDDSHYPAVNVRLFNIAERKGEHVMDTLGLAALGLPDLQCHFRDLNCSKMAGILYTYADYIFQNGDVIEDGNTIQGRTPSEKWKCRHEMAMVDPERVVIDVNPGEPFAAGKRTSLRRQDLSA